MQVPAPFEYERAETVEQALELLRARGPEARLLAGGHSLLPMMKLRLAAPECLIDIDPLAGELGYVREADGEVRIGAMTRHSALLADELLATRLQIFSDAERIIADPIVRNRGTIGGALCQADPAEDLSSVCAAVDAKVVIRGLDGERVLDMHEFHRGPYETAVGPGEMLVEVRVPLPDGAGSAYATVERRVGDWAVASSGAAVRLEGGTIAAAQIALAAVGAGVTSERAAASLAGQVPSEDVFATAADLAGEDCSPTADQRGTEAYKRHLARELTLRTLRRATARALGQEA